MEPVETEPRWKSLEGDIESALVTPQLIEAIPSPLFAQFMGFSDRVGEYDPIICTGPYQETVTNIDEDKNDPENSAVKKNTGGSYICAGFINRVHLDRIVTVDKQTFQLMMVARVNHIGDKCQYRLVWSWYDDELLSHVQPKTKKMIQRFKELTGKSGNPLWRCKELVFDIDMIYPPRDAAAMVADWTAFWLMNACGFTRYYRKHFRKIVDDIEYDRFGILNPAS